MAFVNPQTGIRQQPNVSGFGGYQFTPYAPGEISYGYSNAAAQGFGDTARTLLQSSQNAQQSLIKSFEEQYRHKAQGIAAGQQEYANRLGGEVASQGLAPDLARRMLLGGNASTQAQIGSAYGEAQSGLHQELADLLKGTGVELAHLNQAQVQMLQETLIAKKARKQATQAGYYGLAGGALNAGSHVGAAALLAG